MTRKIDAQKVWAALEGDPQFQREIPPGELREVFRSLIDLFPEAFADQADTPLSIGSLMQAKLTALRCTTENDFISRMIKASPTLAEFSVEDLAGAAQMAVEQMVPMVAEIAHNTAGWLEENGITEEQALGHPKLGKLNEAAMRAYRAGTLTVGGLLELQPSAIIKNTD